ncbi:hypothetical protein SMICM304S_04083 [Streptomyces microflavus]
MARKSVPDPAAFRGQGGAAGELGQYGGEAAADRACGSALRPQQRQAVREFGGERLGRVAVRGDGRAAAFRGAVQAVGHLLQLLGGRRHQAHPVEQRQQRGEQGPQGAGAGGGGLRVVLAVRGGRHRDDQAVHPVDRLAQRGAGGGDGDHGAAAAVRLLGEEGQAGLRAVGGHDEEEVHGAGPAGQRPAQGARGGGDARGVDPGHGGCRARQRADQVGDAGCGGAGAGDEDGAGAALRVQAADAGLGGVPGGGTDPGTCLGGAAEQVAAVGPGQGFRGVEQGLVEHGGGPPITGRGCGVRVRGSVAGVPGRVRGWGAGALCRGAPCPVRSGGAARGRARTRFARGQAGRRASSTSRTGMPSRTG